jgi:hypothetical protein
LKASQINAEHLPGLIDPSLPPEQQPLLDSSNPNPVAHPPQALHPDRFTPLEQAPSEPSAPAGQNKNPPQSPKPAAPQRNP